MSKGVPAERSRCPYAVVRVDIQWFSVALGIAACGGGPSALVDTPIVGGSDEARAAVLAELAAFDEATGGGRTPVSRVEFADLDGPYGVYRRTSHAILLDASLPTAPAVFYNVSLVLRHELCHALNQREDLHREREALYDTLSGQIHLHEGVCTSARCRQDEAFAQACHFGPWIAAFAARGCPTDGGSVAAFEHQAERLWVAADGPRETDLDDWVEVDGVGRGGGAPIDQVWVYTNVIAPDNLRIQWSEAHDESRYELFVDLLTGELVPERYGFMWGSAAKPGGLDPRVRVEGTARTEEGGPFAGIGVAEDVLGIDLVRHLWHDGERWALVGDGCPQVGVTAPPFALDRVFSVEVDGTRIRWAQVSEAR